MSNDSAAVGPYTAETLTAGQNMLVGRSSSHIRMDERKAMLAALLNAEYERGRASRGDLLYTDNSAVVERLQFRVEQLEMRIRDALKHLYEEMGDADNLWGAMTLARLALLKANVAAEKGGTHES